jgi:hypothetical protein
MKDPVKGVRYFLKRPSYVAGLKIDFDKAEFFDYSKSSNCIPNPNPSEPCLTPEKAKKIAKEKKVAKLTVEYSKGTNPWIKANQITNIRDIYCIQIPKLSEPSEPSEPLLEITLQQTMEGEPILFEAESRTTPPHWFADSESAITLDDNSYLTAIMAGEDDKSLEFIQAVAGLAVEAAKLALLDDKGKDRSQCLLIEDDNFHTYVTEYIKLAVQKSNLQEKLKETYQKIELKDRHASNLRISNAAKGNMNNAHVSVTPDTPEQMKLRFELISLLKEEIASIDSELKKLQYKLPPGDFEVKQEPLIDNNSKVIDKGWEQPRPENSIPWITFKLTKQ